MLPPPFISMHLQNLTIDMLFPLPVYIMSKYYAGKGEIMGVKKKFL